MIGVKHEGMLDFNLEDPPAMIKLKGPNRTRGIVSKRLILILILTALMFLAIIDGVGASAIAKDAVQNGGAEINPLSKGVVAINAHKSVYLPNEIAFIEIAVLDSRGRMVCDADVILTITDPDKERTILTTGNGDILVSDQCTYYGATDLPDYYTNYTVNGVGTYRMDLTAVIHEGTLNIDSNFIVRPSVDFDVAREGPTRIYPKVPYTMSITIKANEDYEGPISEYVPASFEIARQEGLRIETVGDTKVLTWNKGLTKGETYTISYEFDAPDVSPYLFRLEGLEIGDWRESRGWTIGSDLFIEQEFFDDFEDGNLTDPDWACDPSPCAFNQWNVEEHAGSNWSHADNAKPPGDNITSENIDLSGVDYANLTFDYEIANFESVDCFTTYVDDGSGSVQLFQVCGTDTNYDESGSKEFDLSESISMTSTVNITLRCLNSAPSEHCYVDNVTVTSYTAAPDPDVINFTIYESSSTSFGTGTLICSLTDVDDGTPDTCATRLEASKDYRAEIQINNSGEFDGPLNNVTWEDISNLLSSGGTVNVSACTYSDNAYAGGESNATACGYSAGTVTFDNETEPIVEQGTYIWASIVFTTGSSPSDASTIVNPYIGNYNDTSDQITVRGPPTLLPGILESTGPDGYGWRQVYNETPDYATGQATRLTGSADRQFYDWGYKEIQISGRKENYWSRDCGWWYVSGESSLNFKLNDSRNDTIYTNDSVSTTKGLASVTYTWNSSDDPGEWIAYVDDGENIYVSFKLYVRGQLNVTNITTNATNPLYPIKGDTVEINATLKDHAGNYINWSYRDNNNTDITPTLTAYITGAGEEFVINLTNYEGDGGWRGNFTPQKIGDHIIIVKASDGHEYWVDGRGSQWIYVNGTYVPDYNEFASVSLSMFLRGLEELGNKLKLSTLLALLLGLVFIKVRWRRWLR